MLFKQCKISISKKFQNLLIWWKSEFFQKKTKSVLILIKNIFQSDFSIHFSLKNVLTFFINLKKKTVSQGMFVVLGDMVTTQKHNLVMG